MIVSRCHLIYYILHYYCFKHFTHLFFAGRHGGEGQGEQEAEEGEKEQNQEGPRYCQGQGWNRQEVNSIRWVNQPCYPRQTYHCRKTHKCLYRPQIRYLIITIMRL